MYYYRMGAEPIVAHASLLGCRGVSIRGVNHFFCGVDMLRACFMFITLSLRRPCLLLGIVRMIDELTTAVPIDTYRYDRFIKVSIENYRCQG